MTPTTATGRALDEWIGAGRRVGSEGWTSIHEDISVIEAQAAAAERARLAELVRELLSLDELNADGPDELYDREGRVVAWPALVSRAAVLALLDPDPK